MLAEIISAIAAWWQNFNMTPEERWLSESSDVGELENRLRRLANQNHNINNFLGGA